jgi:hypothetical protein
MLQYGHSLGLIPTRSILSSHQQLGSHHWRQKKEIRTSQQQMPLKKKEKSKKE